DRGNDGDNSDRQEARDEGAFQPVLHLSAVENDFKARKANRDEENADIVDFSFPARLASSTSCLNSGGSESRRLVRINEKIPMGMLIRNTHRHEKLSVIHPPSGGPTAGAVTIAMLYRAKAAGRFAAGKVSTRMACSTGASPPPPMPCNMRKKIRRPRLG